MTQYDVSSKGEIGRIILREGARLEPGEERQLRFVDGSVWLGSITVSRDDYSFYGDLSFNVEGNLFEGDRSVQIAIVCEPDGPVGWPIRHNGRTYNNDVEEDEYGRVLCTYQTRAQFYADGLGWSADNAPKVKLAISRRRDVEMRALSRNTEQQWTIEIGRKATHDKNKTDAFFYKAGRSFIEALPGAMMRETKTWPQPMPKPARPDGSGPKKKKNQAKHVHKRLSTGEKVAVGHL